MLTLGLMVVMVEAEIPCSVAQLLLVRLRAITQQLAAAGRRPSKEYRLITDVQYDKVKCRLEEVQAFDLDKAGTREKEAN